MGLLDGLGDFLKTPEGQGLLSATFGGLAGARRGAPLNSLGNAGLAGLQGYAGALDRNQQTEQFGQMQKSRDMGMQVQQMQLDEITRKNAEAAKQREWRSGLPAVMAPKYGAGNEGPTLGVDQAGIDRYLMAPDSPYADKMMEQRLFPKAAEGFTLGDGQVRYNANGGVIAQGPEKAESKDSKIKQYEYAKASGYKGSFEQFVTLGPTIMAGAVAPLRAAQEANIYAENKYNLPQPRPAPAAKPGAPMRGQVVQGYRFKGGNPADQSNWEKQ